jgi:hypothetical protein
VETYCVNEAVTLSGGMVTDVCPLPVCSTEGPGCGSCGNGFCVKRCPGSSLVCLDNTTFSNAGCATDLVCPAGAACAAESPGVCGGGLQNGCAQACR